MNALRTQFICCHHFPHSFSAAGIHGKHTLDVWMPRKIRLNSRELFVHGWPGGDLVELDIFPRLLDCFPGTVHARLNVELARGSDETGDLPFANRLNDALA